MRSPFQSMKRVPTWTLVLLALIAGVITVVIADSLHDRYVSFRAEQELNSWRSGARPFTESLLQRWTSGDNQYGKLLLSHNDVVWVEAARRLDRRVLRDIGDLGELRDRLGSVSPLAALRFHFPNNFRHFSWRSPDDFVGYWRSAVRTPLDSSCRAFLRNVLMAWDEPFVGETATMARCRAIDAALALWDAPGEVAGFEVDMLRLANEMESDFPDVALHARRRFLQLTGDLPVDGMFEFETSAHWGLSNPFDEVCELGDLEIDDHDLLLMASSTHPRYLKLLRRLATNPALNSRIQRLSQKRLELPDYLVARPFAFGTDFGLILTHDVARDHDRVLRWRVYGVLPLGTRLEFTLPPQLRGSSDTYGRTETVILHHTVSEVRVWLRPDLKRSFIDLDLYSSQLVGDEGNAGMTYELVGEVPSMTPVTKISLGALVSKAGAPGTSTPLLELDDVTYDLRIIGPTRGNE